MKEDHPHRGYLTTVFSCRCPRCREGKLFKHRPTFNFKRNMEMNERCPVCSQPTDIEVGFYYGTGYVSYAIAFLLSIVSLVLWWVLIGFSFSDNRFFYWITTNAVLLILLQPWLMRFARSLWLSWFVRYDPGWRNKQPDGYERIVEGQMNNW